MQKQIQYLPYGLSIICPHSHTKSSTNYLDVACNKRSETYHRISQAGKICNKCATLIMRCVNSVDQCPCCSDSLQILISQAWICSHSNRSFDQVNIKCMNNERDIHQIPLKSKVCKNCYERIRAAFMFSNQCLVCCEKESQIFENIQKTITRSSFYFFQEVIKQMREKKCSEEDIKSELQHYCLAAPIQAQFKSKFENQSKQFGENLPENHQSKRYQLFPKCPHHRSNPVNLCNNCLVSILNVKSCPYGCPYQKKELRAGKVEAAAIRQSGFLCLYPKQSKDCQYLQYFSVKHIQQTNRDRWEGTIRKVKYSGENNICNKFSLYAASIQIGKSSFLQCGGTSGDNISNMKTTSSSFIIHLSQNNKNFSVEDLPKMREGRSGHSLIVCKQYVYVVGGYNKQQKKAIKSCEKLNIKQKSWSQVSDLKVQRSRPSILEYKGKIYVFGGLSTNEQIWTTQCQSYNIEKDIWELCQYKGYDIPYITGLSFLNNIWGFNHLENIVVLGGSNYQMATPYMQDMDLLGGGFKLNYLDLSKKLNFTRVNASVSLMKTQTQNEKIILVFGGLQEHELLLSFDAIRMKVNKNQISPIFTYEEVPIGSYQFLLRENRQSAYLYMVKKLREQGLISKQKLQEKGEEEILKSEATLHLIEKMWYGVGKCIVGYNS